jgi:hypothetical protein
MQKLALGPDRLNAKLASRYICNAKGKEKRSPVIIEVSVALVTLTRS